MVAEVTRSDTCTCQALLRVTSCVRTAVRAHPARGMSNSAARVPDQTSETVRLHTHGIRSSTHTRYVPRAVQVRTSVASRTQCARGLTANGVRSRVARSAGVRCQAGTHVARCARNALHCGCSDRVPVGIRTVRAWRQGIRRAVRPERAVRARCLACEGVRANGARPLICDLRIRA